MHKLPILNFGKTPKPLSIKQILIFDEIILNNITNFIPYETKIFNDREPPCINNKVKTIIQAKKQYLLALLRNKSNMVACKLESLQNLLYETLATCKRKYYKNISKRIMF